MKKLMHETLDRRDKIKEIKLQKRLLSETIVFVNCKVNMLRNYIFRLCISHYR